MLVGIGGFSNSCRCEVLETTRCDLIRQLARNHEVIFIAKEGLIGGFGLHIAQFLACDGLLDGKLKLQEFETVQLWRHERRQGGVPFDAYGLIHPNQIEF